MRQTKVIMIALLFATVAHAEKIDFNSLINEIDTTEASAKVISPNRLARATSLDQAKRLPSSDPAPLLDDKFQLSVDHK